MLLFGTMEEIAARRHGRAPARQGGHPARAGTGAGQRRRPSDLAVRDADPGPTAGPGPDRLRLGRAASDGPAAAAPEAVRRPRPARLAEIFDFLHRGLTVAAENIQANEDGTEVRLGFAEWQTIQAVQMLLARYMRAVADPNHQADW